MIRPVPTLFALLAALALAGAVHAAGHAGHGTITLTPIGGFDHGGFDEGAAEIAAYDPASERLFVVNSEATTLDVLDLSDPTAPTLIEQRDMTAFGDGANSVAVHDGLVAVAIEADAVDANGVVLFTDADGTVLAQHEAGVLPDMLTFTPDGMHVVVANEGEPSDDYAVDPEGSITIIDLPDDRDPAAAAVRQVDFRAFDGREDVLRAEGVRIYGPGATTSQDLEPEYVAIPEGTLTAYVALQENNALAVVDLVAGEVTDVVALGLKDWSRLTLDVNDDDGVASFASWPIHGMYQPDAIAPFTVDGRGYVVTANEGDARDYDTFSEEARVEDVELDAGVFGDVAALQAEDALGRLELSTATGDLDGDGAHERIDAYGARSISVWNEAGQLVWDSGDTIETTVAELHPELHNVDNDESAAESFDGRSDAKGPEPEGVVVGHVDGTPYAFVGLERVGGVMTFDLSDPTAPTFAGYHNDRPIDAAADGPDGGDLGPEGLVFVPADASPNGRDLLIVAFEISGTTRIYEVGHAH